MHSVSIYLSIMYLFIYLYFLLKDFPYTLPCHRGEFKQLPRVYCACDYVCVLKREMCNMQMYICLSVNLCILTPLSVTQCVDQVKYASTVKMLLGG